MSSDFIISVSSLSKQFLLYARPRDRLKQFFFGRWKRYFTPVDALRNVSFQLRRGETVGIIGRNGSGKSTLLQLLCGTLTPGGGEIKVEGRIAALLELGSGFHPEFTGRENVYLNGAILGMSKKEIDEKFSAIETFAGIGPFIEQAVKTYSSGMFVRLAFAVAVASDPDILIVDEALAVGDEAFQRKCFARIRELQQKGCTILFVSHSAQMVVELCQRAILLDRGELLMDDAARDVMTAYHKLIFAPAEQQEEIRARIQEKNFHETTHSTLHTPHSSGHFDPALQPESFVEYPSHGGRITDVRVTDIKGQQVNILTQGERYSIRYRLTFEEGAEQVKCGTLIKSRTGLELGGGYIDCTRSGHAIFRAGESIELNFTFRCTLLPGHYFLNAGSMRRKNGEDAFIHRLVDVLQFRVMPSDETASMVHGGIATLDFDARIHK